MDDRLIAAVARHDSLADLDPARRRLALRALAAHVVDEKDVAASVAEISDAIDGYGPLSELMSDDCVTDIAVNGPHDVWVERAGVFERSPAVFENRKVLGAFIERLFATAGARIDASFPIADACMPDGTRIHAVLPPIAPAGPFLSIRRFPHARFTLDDLVARSMLTDEQGAYLAAAVRDRRTLAISGGTGTGKTTLLNALLDHVGSSERVVVIEEIPELQRRGDNRASLVARPPNVEGAGAIDLHALARAALRMRPDRLVVGEVRGPEAFAALAALATGHEGSMVTLHARSPADAVERMVTMALQAGLGATEVSLRRQTIAAFDVIVHLERRSGRRAVRCITDVSNIE